MQKGDSSMSRNKKEMGNAGKPEHPTTSRMASEQPSVQKHSAISETWAQETIEDLDYFNQTQWIKKRQ